MNDEERRVTDMTKIENLAKQWVNGPDEAEQRLTRTLEEAKGRIDLDARTRNALAFVLVENKKLRAKVADLEMTACAAEDMRDASDRKLTLIQDVIDGRVFCEADFSGLEMRIASQLQDETILEETDDDV